MEQPGSLEMSDLSVRRDVAPRAMPDAFAFDDRRPAPRLLLVGRAKVDDAINTLASRAGLRVVAAVSHDRAAVHLAQMAAVDLVWLCDAQTMAGNELVGLMQGVAERRCRLLCETTLAALDAMVAAIPAETPVDFLVDADDTERLMTLVAASTVRPLAVHDVARDDAAERIDRLQEEVSRISRLLGDLAGQRHAVGGLPSFATPIDEHRDVAPQLRAPQRDFALAPRSFVPEEPLAAQRFKARQVRRIIRQRRVREQFFPADLFADPAWDMLLDLYAAKLERQPVSVSSLCIAAAVPATTALRWIKTMTDADIFVREADPHDGRRIFIALAEESVGAMTRYFEALEE